MDVTDTKALCFDDEEGTISLLLVCISVPDLHNNKGRTCFISSGHTYLEQESSLTEQLGFFAMVLVGVFGSRWFY